MDIKIEGLEKLIANIDDIADISKMKTAMGKACALIERDARKNAYSPKGDGGLMNSITSKVDVEGTEIVGTVFSTLDYAPYVEFGTGLFAEKGNGRKDVPWYIHIGYGAKDITPEAVARYHFPVAYGKNGEKFAITSGSHPKPFLRPAFNDNKAKIKQILREGLDV